MARPIGFNPDAGITGIQTPETEDISIPFRNTGVSPALAAENVNPGADTYAGRNLDSIIDAALRPQCSNPDLMRPEVFNRTLKSGLEKLKTGTRNRDIETLCNGISQNSDLLRTYENLVIPG